MQYYYDLIYSVAVLVGVVAVIIFLTIKSKRKSVTGSQAHGYDIRQEFERIKAQISALTVKMQELEIRLRALPELKEQKAQAVSPGIQPKKEEAPGQEARVAPKERKDVEMDLGKYWLNKIGIIIFAVGVAFLITYTFRYFGAIFKIALGYLICASLFFFGIKLEKKERSRNYGRALLGGAWAITYFTTYAMHHFDASRVITSQLLGLVLLCGVAFGIIAHSLKYRSQELSSLALFIGFFTATLGDINYFSVATTLILAVSALIIVYKLQWIRVIFTGIILSYLTHLFWIIKHINISRVVVGELNVSQVYFLLNMGFLSIYWMLFTAGIHFVRPGKDSSGYDKLSAANFINFFLYFFITYPKIAAVYPEFKFTFVFGLGVIYLAIALLMEKIKNGKLFTSNIIIAVSLLTLAMPLKFAGFHTSLIWLVEIPFLLMTGILFNRKVLRYLSVAVAAVLFFKYIYFDYSLRGAINLFGLEFSWLKFLALLGAVSSGACFYLAEYSGKKPVLSLPEQRIYNLFSAFCCVYLTIFIWSVSPFKWLSFFVTVEALLFFTLGFALLDAYLRSYALILFFMLFCRILIYDDYGIFNTALKWSLLIFEIAGFYTLYFLYKMLELKTGTKRQRVISKTAVFVFSTALMVFLAYKYVPRMWVSIALGMEGVLLFLAGFISKDRVFRFGGFVVFAITLLRVVFVDLAMLHIIYKIISFIILGLLFLGVSYAYTKYSVKK